VEGELLPAAAESRLRGGAGRAPRAVAVARATEDAERFEREARGINPRVATGAALLSPELLQLLADGRQASSSCGTSSASPLLLNRRASPSWSSHSFTDSPGAQSRSRNACS